VLNEPKPDMFSALNVPENLPSLEELKRLWQQDCRKLLPNFELYDNHRMDEAIRIAEERWATDDASDLEVIAHVLRSLDDEYEGYGIPGNFWWISAIQAIFPEIDIHPWLQVMVHAAYEARGKRELLSFWGSASSSKSRSFSIIALVEMVIWVGEAHVFVTSPYKTAGSDKVWLGFKNYSDRWAAKRPEWMEVLGLSCESTKDDIKITNADGYSSTAAFVSLESASSVIGKKSQYLPGNDPAKGKRGRMLVISDEIIHNPAACQSLREAEANLVANSNVLTLAGMNPIGWQVRHPQAIELSMPIDVPVETLEEHRDYVWKTQRGKLFRFCTDLSPNRHAIEPAFPYLINYAQEEAQRKRGDDAYAAQAAAWGWGSGAGTGGVLTIAAAQTPAWQGEPVWKSPKKRWAFFDLAFGGDDPAGFCCLESGVCQNAEGKDIEVISAVEQDRMRVDGRWKPTHAEITEFNELCHERGGKPPALRAGEVQKDGNANMVFLMLRTAKRLNIPRGMVSFDSSLRPDVTIIAREALGETLWYYDAARALKVEEENWPLFPPETLPDGSRKRWSQCHTRPISAFWRFAEHIIVRGNVRNLSKVTTGLFELISRRWIRSSKGDHMDLEGKKEVIRDKQRGGKSPMWGETLAMAIVFGARFVGALPGLYKEAPIAVGRTDSFLSHPAFRLQSFRPARSIWSA